MDKVYSFPSEAAERGLWTKMTTELTSRIDEDEGFADGEGPERARTVKVVGRKVLCTASSSYIKIRR